MWHRAGPPRNPPFNFEHHRLIPPGPGGLAPIVPCLWGHLRKLLRPVHFCDEAPNIFLVSIILYRGIPTSSDMPTYSDLLQRGSSPSKMDVRNTPWEQRHSNEHGDTPGGQDPASESGRKEPREGEGPATEEIQARHHRLRGPKA